MHSVRVDVGPASRPPSPAVLLLVPVPAQDRGSQAAERTHALIDSLPEATAAERAAVREEVVLLHLRLASTVARRYGPARLYDDLVQVARLGLVEAFDRFDPDQNSYAHFAWVTMTGLLRRHLRDHGWAVRPPRALQESSTELRRVLPDLTQDLGRTPSDRDVAGHLGWSVDDVRDAELANQGLTAVGIDALGDRADPEHSAEEHRAECRVLLGRALQSLSEDERELLQLRFLDELTQVQIAARLATSQMAVSRRLTRLLLKLRTEIGELDDRGAAVGGTRRAGRRRSAYGGPRLDPVLGRSRPA